MNDVAKVNQMTRLEILPSPGLNAVERQMAMACYNASLAQKRTAQAIETMMQVR